MLPAREAHAWGLVQELVTGSQVLRRARELAETLVALPPEALAETKRLFGGASGAVASDPQASEAFVRCLASGEAKEKIRRFLERR